MKDDTSSDYQILASTQDDGNEAAQQDEKDPDSKIVTDIPVIVVEETEEDLTYLQSFQQVCRRSGPYIGSQVVVMAADFLGAVMIASLGDNELAASSLISSLQSWLLNTTGATLSAVTSIAGAHYGAGELDLVNNTWNQGLYFGLLVSIPGVIGMLASKYVFLGFKQSPDIVDIASQYFYYASWGIPARFLTKCNREIALSIKQSLPILGLDTFFKLMNLGLSYCFIYGEYGFPKFGVNGLGLATSISSWGSFLAFFVYLKYFTFLKNHKLSILDFNWLQIKYFGKIGGPMGLKVFIELGALLASTLIIGALSKDNLESHEASFQYIMLMSTPIFSVMGAINGLVSNSRGAKNLANAKKLGNSGIFLGVSFCALSLILFISIPNQLLGLFIDVNNPDNADIVSLARILLILNGAFALPDAICNIASGGLSGCKDTWIPTKQILTITVLLHVPLGLLLGIAAKMGAVGVMLARGITIVCRTFPVTYRWHHMEKLLPLGHVAPAQDHNQSDTEEKQLLLPPADSKTGINYSSEENKQTSSVSYFNLFGRCFRHNNKKNSKSVSERKATSSRCLMM